MPSASFQHCSPLHTQHTHHCSIFITMKRTWVLPTYRYPPHASTFQQQDSQVTLRTLQMVQLALGMPSPPPPGHPVTMVTAEQQCRNSKACAGVPLGHALPWSGLAPPFPPLPRWSTLPPPKNSNPLGSPAPHCMCCVPCPLLGQHCVEGPTATLAHLDTISLPSLPQPSPLNPEKRVSGRREAQQ